MAGRHAEREDYLSGLNQDKWSPREREIINLPVRHTLKETGKVSTAFISTFYVWYVYYGSVTLIKNRTLTYFEL